MFERTLYIVVLIGFFILSGIGVYVGNREEIPWSEWITENGRWVLVFANVLFLVLAFRQLSVWNISVEEPAIILKRYLGLKKITLHEKDFTYFTVERYKEPWWMKNSKTTIIVKLHTTEGKVTFNSSDYRSFKRRLTQLFSQNKEMRMKCLAQISRLETNTGV